MYHLGEPSYTVDGDVNWYSHYGKQYGDSLKKKTIPLLDIYPEKTIVQEDTCTPVFTAALLTEARTWKQPKRLSTKEWIKKV